MEEPLVPLDIDALRQKLCRHRAELDIAIKAQHSQKVAASRIAMFDYLAKLDLLAFDLHQSGMTGIRRQIILILSDADAYLIAEQHRLRAILLRASTPRQRHPEPEQYGPPTAKLSSDLIQRTKNLKTLRQKMAERRLIDED